jgi:hypothetical protein
MPRKPRKPSKARQRAGGAPNAARVEYQTWALDRQGNLLHAGVRTWDRVGPSTIRKYVADWEAWADQIANKHPDCPTAHSRRKTFTVAVHPVGKPSQTQWFGVHK